MNFILQILHYPVKAKVELGGGKPSESHPWKSSAKAMVKESTALQAAS
jgi:hypothetical protein